MAGETSWLLGVVIYEPGIKCPKPLSFAGCRLVVWLTCFMLPLYPRKALTIRMTRE